MMLMPELTEGTRCRCGSRTFHHLDYGRGAYLLVCESKLHETPQGPTFPIAARHLACTCGGYFGGLIQGMHVYGPDGEPVPFFQDLCCPLCFAVLRLSVAPERALHGDNMVVRALDYRRRVFEAIPEAARERMLDLQEALLDLRPVRSGLWTAIRRGLVGLGDVPPPDRRHPLHRELSSHAQRLRRILS